MGASIRESKTVLITGGAGFIGTHLARELLTRNDSVISLDLRGVGENPVSGVRYLTGDARDPVTVADILATSRVSAVFHFAATVSVPLCQNHPVESYSNNVNATLAVLDACRGEIERRKGASDPTPLRVAFASSAALYGNLGDHRQPLEENRIADRFSSFYAAQKHASEKIVELYCDFFSVPTLIFRFFNVYGQGQDPTSPYSGVITVFSRLAREGKNLPLHGGGIQTRDFIPVSELVKAAASALELAPSEWKGTVINLGSGLRTSVRELAELIRDLSGSRSAIVDAPSRPGDVLHSLADIRRAREFLAFAPSATLAIKLAELLGEPRSSCRPRAESPARPSEKTRIPLAPETPRQPVASPLGR